MTDRRYPKPARSNAARFCLSFILLFTIGFIISQRLAGSPPGGESAATFVQNRLRPDKSLKGPTHLSLVKEFSLATGNQDVLMIGLTDIHSFDIDPAGNIYIIQWMTSENHVFKFDSRGRFLKSFIRKGQGPGEIEWGGTVLFVAPDRLLVKDPSKEKVLFFDTDGKYLSETFLGTHMEVEAVLSNGNYLTTWPEIGPDLEKTELWLCNPRFEKTKLLTVESFPNRQFAPRIKIGDDRMIYAASRDKIFAGYSADGYLVRAFDADGNLKRTVKKEYDPAPISDEEKRIVQRIYGLSPERSKLTYADHWPPFRYCFADEEGRLFVMTFERKPNTREATYDVFDTDGNFITRIGLDNMDENILLLPVKVRGGRFYCLRVDDDGYRELVVYKPRWS